jgi:hypothetical protein
MNQVWWATGTATISDADMGDIADSVAKHAVSATMPASSIGKILKELTDSLDTQSWATSGTSCGSGGQVVTILVLDTSGIDIPIANVNVTVLNALQTLRLAWGATGGSGAVTGFGLSSSTAYKVSVGGSGYIFPLYSMTTGSGATHTDTVRGYDVIPTNSTPTAQKTTLYDWATIGVDTLYGAKVSITLVGSTNFYSSTDLVPPMTWVVYASPTTAVWEKTLFGTDSLSAPGGAAATYNILIEHPMLELSGQKIEYHDLVIPANGTTTRLRTIVAGQ